MPPRSYIAIDLKSFYASVECADRKLDPLSISLVVADQSRTDKTICLAPLFCLRSNLLTFHITESAIPLIKRRYIWGGIESDFTRCRLRYFDGDTLKRF